MSNRRRCKIIAPTLRITSQPGALKVQELTPAMPDKWLRDLQKAGLSYNTISSLHAFLSNALNYAVYPTELIISNPAVYIKVPKNAPRNIVKRHIIIPERFAELLTKYPFGTPLYIPLLLLYHTGMRLGEVLGLCWSDVDFEAKKITLSRQIAPISGKGYFFTTLKTELSARYIIIDDVLLEELRRWHIQQTANEKHFGGSYVYVYREEDGHIQHQSRCLSVLDVEKISLVCAFISPHARDAVN